MRRGLEARGEADPTRGEQCDVLSSEEPADSLGGIARVGVVREKHAEPAVELLVEGRKQERQGRLGDACAGRQRPGERGQALVRPEAPDESVK